MRYGLLEVICEGQRRAKRKTLICFCDCGKIKSLLKENLVTSHTRSCGCLRNRVIHGHATGGAESPEYQSWLAMKSRCNNPNNVEYHNYGGRGIKVCARWQTSFQLFIIDMGLKPSSKHLLERIDNNRGYSPDNCKWATMREQSRNQRSNRLLSFKGETLCLTDWAIKKNIDPKALESRLRMGWSIERALTEKSHAKCVHSYKRGQRVGA